MLSLVLCNVEVENAESTNAIRLEQYISAKRLRSARMLPSRRSVIISAGRSHSPQLISRSEGVRQIRVWLFPPRAYRHPNRTKLLPRVHSHFSTSAPKADWVPGSSHRSDYLDISRSFIYVKGKIIDATGGDNAATVEIGPLNNPLHSIFSNVDIDLGGNLISDPNGLYPYRAYIETLLSYSKEAQESLLQTAIWSTDTPGKMAIKDSVGGGARNTGLKARTVFFSKSAEAEMTGRLHADIFHQPKAIPQNTSLKVKLT